MTEQLPLELGHRPALGRDDFLISDSNREAVGWIDAWPDWPAPGLVIVGPAASGKSHLAQVWCTRAGATMVGRDELAEPAAAARLAARERIVVDDADRAPDERSLLHLYNLLVECGGSLLLTAAEPPSRWPLRLADLRSRLAALPVVAIRPPDDTLVQAVLVKLFADRQIRVDPELIAYLTTRLARSLAVAADAVNVLDRAALAAGRALTIPFARDTLRGAGLLS